MLFNIECMVNATESVCAHSKQSAGWVLWPISRTHARRPRQISAETRPPQPRCTLWRLPNVLISSIVSELYLSASTAENSED